MGPRDCLLAISIGIALAGTASPATARVAPNSNGQIHACYGRFDQNELHMTGPQSSCPPGETSLTWNKHVRSASSAGAGKTIYELSVTTESNTTAHRKQSLSDTVSTLANLLLLVGLCLLGVAVAVSLALTLLGLLLRFLLHWRFLWLLPLFRPLFRLLGPVLRVEPFEDSAMASRLGTPFAFLTQTKLGQREVGRHLYLVTGDQIPSRALAALQEVPQTRALAATLSLLRGTWARSRLIVSGSLMPVGRGGVAAVALTLRRRSKFVATTNIWPTERPSSRMTADTSNQVLAVAAAGWIEHTVADETPGPRAHDVYLSRDPKSWALFRAGAELSRISHLAEAADAYERALAIDPENVGALVDLAHLRRRDGHFEGAAILARSAVDLVDARGRTPRGVRTGDDSDWYRAQIVLATVYSEWAKSVAQKEGDRANILHERACKQAVTVALTAIQSRDRIERLLSDEELERAAGGAKVRLRARLKARWLSWRDERRRFDAARMVDLHDLLITTFEPGALLLIAGNCLNRNEQPPAESPFEFAADSPDGQRRKLVTLKVREAREKVKEEVKSGTALKPVPLIEYVSLPPLKSPRVLYNLACHYSLAAERADDDQERQVYIDIAFEYLRQSISRFPPPERRSALDRVTGDGDLKALLKTRRSKIWKLRKLIPA